MFNYKRKNEKKQVAVLEINSSELIALVGERGVNGTFVLKGFKKYPYDGYVEGKFLDENDLINKIRSAVLFLGQYSKKELKKIYVGAPGEFTVSVVKEGQVSFSDRRAVTVKDINALFDSSFSVNTSRYVLINRSSVFFRLDDMRKVSNPVGCQSEMLKGTLSYAVCDAYFVGLITDAMHTVGMDKIEFISSILAEAVYLFDEETRNRAAVLLDMGYISSTLAVIYGDGVISQKSFAYGNGVLTGCICDSLEVDFETAEKIVKRINLSEITSADDRYEIWDGAGYRSFSADGVKKTAVESLDGLCEKIEAALAESNVKLPEYLPLFVTGSGAVAVRGALEHVSARIGRLTERIAPQVPNFCGTQHSSYLSLLDLALSREEDCVN